MLLAAGGLAFGDQGPRDPVLKLWKIPRYILVPRVAITLTSLRAIQNLSSMDVHVLNIGTHKD